VERGEGKTERISGASQLSLTESISGLNMLDHCGLNMAMLIRLARAVGGREESEWVADGSATGE
jgi:hypothetical protein